MLTHDHTKGNSWLRSRCNSLPASPCLQLAWSLTWYSLWRPIALVRSMDSAGGVSEWWSPAWCAQGRGSVLSTAESRRVEVFTWYILTNLYKLGDLQYECILLQSQKLQVHNPGVTRGYFFWSIWKNTSWPLVFLVAAGNAYLFLGSFLALLQLHVAFFPLALCLFSSYKDTSD